MLREDLDQLIQVLRSKGFTVLGPSVRDGAVAVAPIESAAELPAGVAEEQSPGRYRLSRTGDVAVFAHTVGPSSWKRFLLPPVSRLYRLERDGNGFVQPARPDDSPPKYALLGIRPCDLAALSSLDRVLMDGAYPEPDYASRRRGCFIIAVQCGRPADTCFCSSMGSGPKAERGFDLALTEILDGDHRFHVQAGTKAGAEVMSAVKRRRADASDQAAARSVWDSAAAAIRVRLETTGLAEALSQGTEHSAWGVSAAACLGCGNCTMVCPTCFCSTFEDSSDVSGRVAERWRKQDSCFNTSFSYIHGGAVRCSLAARFRQRIMHKLVWWRGQFNSSGCTGCGRCSTWCPAGIDFPREAEALRASIQAR